jgi:TRAP transporter T-component
MNILRCAPLQLPSLLLLLISSGCNLNRFAADQAASIAGQSTAYMRGFWDYEIARHGTASAIMQLEAMHSVSPDNETLTLALVSAYVGHAFGWVELDMEQARANLQFDKANRLRSRAELIYRRARDLALHVLRKRDAGIDELLLGEPSALTAYLKDRYGSIEDLAPVFWAASAWGSMLNQTDQLDAAADLPMIRAMIEHVVAVDPGYESGTGLVFLGGLYAQTPADFGGDPAKGKAYFERALALTERKSHVVQLNYAKLYALTTGDQKLFRALLDEILDPRDQGNPVRLSNKIARMHAELLVKTQSHSP